MQTASDLSRKFTFGEAAELFRHYSEESFVAFYLSKKWNDLLCGRSACCV